jgi:hypothetical protein
MGLGWLLILFVAIVLPRPGSRDPGHPSGTRAPATNTSAEARPGGPNAGLHPHYRSIAAMAPGRTAEQIATDQQTAEEVVANKLQLLARSRREFVHALARKRGIALPEGVERFFDAVEAGDWKEIQARYDAINGGDRTGTTLTPARPAGMEALWPAIHDAYGAAETAQRWPAQELLDYGHAVLDALRPGMVYLGGTEGGRWIPELLNEAGEGERHIMLTQNALADPNYLNYVNLVYGDQFAALDGGDASRAYSAYLADYQKRLTHDQQFPDEPKQIRAGENDGVRVGDDGQLQVYGPKSAVSVSAINEQLLQLLLQKNPGLSFAMEESYPLPSLSAGAAPLGPIMELRASDGQNSLSAGSATQSLAYWQAATQQLLSDPGVSSSSDTLKTYAHDLAAQGRLFVGHDLNAQAEQAFQLANQLTPANPEVVFGYVGLLARESRFDEAREIVETALGATPDSPQFQKLLTQLSRRH